MYIYILNIYIYKFVYIYIYTYACICIHMYVYMCVCICVYIYICVFVRVSCYNKLICRGQRSLMLLCPMKPCIREGSIHWPWMCACEYVNESFGPSIVMLLVSLMSRNFLRSMATGLSHKPSMRNLAHLGHNNSGNFKARTRSINGTNLPVCHGHWASLGHADGWFRPTESPWAGIFPYYEWIVNFHNLKPSMLGA